MKAAARKNMSTVGVVALVAVVIAVVAVLLLFSTSVLLGTAGAWFFDQPFKAGWSAGLASPWKTLGFGLLFGGSLSASSSRRGGASSSRRGRR